VFGTRDENVFKAASGLHGGIGGMGDVCGAVLGASLMLGLMCGSSIEEAGKPSEHFDPAEGDVSTRLVGEIYQWFENEFSSVKCAIVRTRFERAIEHDGITQGLAEPEMMARVHAKCDELAGKTAARTAEILWDVLKK
jgi:C_GCAxxG_C_C family probable redox protein